MPARSRLMDKWLGTLYEALKAQRRLDDTLVIFTGDQGEPLGEHGYVRRFRPWLYDELIHTPLIVRMPGAKHGGGRHQALVQTVDLLPTVVAALGLAPIEGVHGHDSAAARASEASGRSVRDYACMGKWTSRTSLFRTHPSWHLTLPVGEPDPDDLRAGRNSTASPRTAGTRTTSRPSSRRSRSTWS